MHGLTGGSWKRNKDRTRATEMKDTRGNLAVTSGSETYRRCALPRQLSTLLHRRNRHKRPILAAPHQVNNLTMPCRMTGEHHRGVLAFAFVRRWVAVCSRFFFLTRSVSCTPSRCLAMIRCVRMQSQCCVPTSTRPPRSGCPLGHRLGAGSAQRLRVRRNHKARSYERKRQRPRLVEVGGVAGWSISGGISGRPYPRRMAAAVGRPRGLLPRE